MGDTYPRTEGCFRRLIDLRREPDGAVVGWLEDDFHHFGLTLEHNGERVTGVKVASVRVPFTTCPAAAINLLGIIGNFLSERSTDVGAMIPMREQCTHMFDLAGLAMAHAATGRSNRRYEAIIPDRDIIAWESGRRRLLGQGQAWLLRDGEEVLRWAINERTITGPDNWAGQSMVESFRAKTEALPLEKAEAATVLRRAVMVAGGRTLDPDLIATARERGPDGACYTFLERNRDAGLRVFGSTMNYEKGSAGMLCHLAERP